MLDLISLSEQFPGLTVSVSLEDLLTAGRKLNAEIIDIIASKSDEAITRRESDEFLTREETCKKLNISGATIWRWKKNGYLVPVKVGSMDRYRLSDINAILTKKGGAL